ncbi:Hypothetical predicted protein [Lecanosticta acicola]|uniref:Uncharacterized protein n=1 Tax=Lecanosticta acicola TaxID=111012 RepID=A0AAI8YRA7_9PEZI|nr:Hypothetical predicted protein [Lecanosticta acicola]
MPPKKGRAQAQKPTPRRSSRIASSRASSKEPEAPPHGLSALSSVQMPAPTAPQPVTQEEGFDIDRAMRVILLNRAYIQQLTEAQKDAAINRFVDREVNYRNQIEELERRAEEAEEERDKEAAAAARLRKNSFRIHLFMEEVQKREKAKQAEIAKSDAEQQTPAAGPRAVSNTPAAEEQPESAISTANKPQTLATASTTPLIEPSFISFPQQAVTPVPSKSFLSRLVSSFPSPFTSLKKNVSQTSYPGIQPQQSQARAAPSTERQPQEPLGELPVSRKRAAEDEEPVTESAPGSAATSAEASISTPRASSTNMSNSTPRRPHTVHATRTRFTDTPMTAISEHSEISDPSEPSGNTFSVPEPTPSRRHPMPRPRGIVQARLQAQLRNQSKTPGRPWAAPTLPREPNADARLEKLWRYRDLDNQLKALKDDPEVKQMVSRPVKRMKIEDLPFLPHHRPGEPSGTFRVPDVDADGEMEVDEDESLFNIFNQEQDKEKGKNIETESEKDTLPPAPRGPTRAASEAVSTAAPMVASPAASAAVSMATAPVAQPAPQAEKVSAIVYNFPDVGTNNLADRDAYPYDEMLGAKFTYGFETWKAAGVSAVTW